MAASKAKPTSRATVTQKQSILPQKRAGAALTDITNNKKPATAVSKKAVAPTVSVAQPLRSKAFAQHAELQPAPVDSCPMEVETYNDDEMDVDLPMDELEAEEIAEDIDAADINDPQSVVEYVEEIYEYCRGREIKYAIPQDYMSKQLDINEKMRAILIDWMLEVHLKFKLLPETMFLSVNIIDRFLTLKCVAREQLQLVGVTAMFIASKYEEIYPPECNDFVYISAQAYTKEQILSMEQCILNTLGFNLTAPTSLHFLRRFSKAARSDYRIHTLSKFLIETALVDMRMSTKYLPSMIAASAVYLARVMTNTPQPIWNSTLEHYTKYKESQLVNCVRDLNDTLRRTHEGTLQAVVRKYSIRKFGEVAKIPMVDI
eukprot:TRINITY_DN3753_c0_g1_i1.p1 TRINITY_DN3753_c0_g1~~TRINITY_DN3753_c0_g1_i1.p1  ORF type:complete len:423 (-),score=100.32 TRINITY_DN3753_c0_g1_i1:109-1230(-)